jgi:dynein heavy chain
MTYLEEYMGDFLFDKNRKFYFSKTPEFNYAQPAVMSLEGFINAVNKIPLINSPIVFGLHPNAEITYYTNPAKNLWDNLLSMQVSSGVKTSDFNRDKYIDGVANEVLSKLP